MVFKEYNGASYRLLTSYDANKPFSYIIYLVTHNLYGQSMVQLLPTETLDWVNPKGFNLNTYYNGIPIGWWVAWFA